MVSLVCDVVVNIFWMLQVPEVDFWVIPIIQGFVQVEELVVNYNETSDDERSSPETPPQEVTCVDDIHPRFTVALISRRSRHRAGREDDPWSARFILVMLGFVFTTNKVRFTAGFESRGGQFSLCSLQVKHDLRYKYSQWC